MKSKKYTGKGYHQNQHTKFSIIIPTYNEGKIIQTTIDQIQDALQAYNYEIIVVDDDSPDGTWKIVENEYSSTADIHVIRRTNDSGLGTAVLRGFNSAQGEIVAVIDADLQHPPEKLEELYTAFEDDVDVVIGSRNLPEGGIENWPRRRQVISKGAAFLSKIAVPSARGVTDPMSGFFAVRREILQDVDLNPSGFKILLEVLTRCEYDRVVEIPYVFTDRERGESNLGVIEYINFLEHIISLAVVGRGLDRYVTPALLNSG